MKAIGRIEAAREFDGKVEIDTRTFALARRSPDQLLATGRGTGRSRTRCTGSSTSPSARMPPAIEKTTGQRQLRCCAAALSMSRLDKSKGSLTEKIKRAGWNQDFLVELLSHMR